MTGLCVCGGLCSHRDSAPDSRGGDKRQYFYHGFPPYFGAIFLPIIVLIGAAEKRMMLDEFDAVNKKQKEKNKKPKDMQKKRNIE